MKTLASKEIGFGAISFAGKDLPPQPARYDRIAVGERQSLLLVSIVAEVNFVKAIRSILGGGAKADIQAAGAKVRRPDRPHDMQWTPSRLVKTDELYDCHTQKLDHGLMHAIFITRAEGFMPTLTDEALWRELLDTRFTTPILRDWLPYIRTQLEKLELLVMASSFNVRCGMLSATDENLDFIVSTGLKKGLILIPQS
jgi:hypothetical protein